MKKRYEKPVMAISEFTPNEYCSTCSDLEGGVKYKFKCTAGDGVYGGLYDLDWNLRSNDYNSYHACDETHESSTTDMYYLGYFDPDKNHNNGNEIPVYIWEEREWVNGSWWNGGEGYWNTIDRHATVDLNKETWEKNHS